MKEQVIYKTLSNHLLSTLALYSGFPTTDQLHHFSLIKADKIKTE